MQITINSVEELRELARMALADEFLALRAENARLERKLQEATNVIRELSVTCHDAHAPLVQLAQTAGSTTTTNVTNNFQAPVGTSIAAADQLKTRELYVGR